jgi:uncharacterized protein
VAGSPALPPHPTRTSPLRLTATAAAPAPAAVPPVRYFGWWLPAMLAAWAGLAAFVLPDPLAAAQANWPLVLVGVAGSLLGNATAVGGGLVFVPVMILVLHLHPVQALQVALVGQCFGMTSGAFGWLARRAVPMSALAVSVPALLVGSTFSTLVVRPNAMLVKGLFGPVSVLIGLLVLYLLDRHPHTHDDIPRRAFLPLAVVATVGGVITGWIAIGEGEIVAAFLMLGYGLAANRGIGLGTVLLSINSIYLASLHAAFIGGIPWEIAMFVGLGCLFGGRLGPFLAQWVRPRRLKVGFAVVAIADGLLMIWQSLR